MTSETIGVLGIVAMCVLLVAGVPVAMALVAVGLVGAAMLNGLDSTLYSVASQTFATASQYDLAVIPLFILMGNIASRSGLSRDLYDAAFAWIGRFRGGLASATILGCAGFSALSGSSVAAAVTMGQVALPEMKRYKYSDALATGSVAAGGTLGILIPPSTGFILYGVLTEQSIGKLFVAGVLPGLLMTVCFILAIVFVTTMNPEAGPRGEVVPLGERFRALARASIIGFVILLTIGGIYGGLFTPAEAAGVGAVLTLFASFLKGSMPLSTWKGILQDSVKTTSMVFLILIGAHIFGPFLSLSGLPHMISSGLNELDVNPYVLILVILAGYIVLGMFLEGMSLLVISLPIVYPVIIAAGFDPIWFGVIAVIVLEMGLISPPVGVNVFVVASIAKGVPLGTVFKGILPFWIAMLICSAILVAFPEIALYLPSQMSR